MDPHQSSDPDYRHHHPNNTTSNNNNNITDGSNIPKDDHLNNISNSSIRNNLMPITNDLTAADQSNLLGSSQTDLRFNSTSSSFSQQYLSHNLQHGSRSVTNTINSSLPPTSSSSSSSLLPFPTSLDLPSKSTSSPSITSLSSITHPSASVQPPIDLYRHSFSTTTASTSGPSSSSAAVRGNPPVHSSLANTFLSSSSPQQSTLPQQQTSLPDNQFYQSQQPKYSSNTISNNSILPPQSANLNNISGSQLPPLSAVMTNPLSSQQQQQQHHSKPNIPHQQQQILSHDASASNAKGTLSRHITSVITHFTATKYGFRRLVNELEDFLHVLSPTGAILYASQSSIRNIGVSPEDLEGRHIAEFLHPEDNELVLNLIQNSLKSHETVREEYSAYCRFRRSNGEFVLMDLKGKPFPENVAEGPIKFLVHSAREYRSKGSLSIDSILELRLENLRLRHQLEASLISRGVNPKAHPLLKEDITEATPMAHPRDLDLDGNLEVTLTEEDFLDTITGGGAGRGGVAGESSTTTNFPSFPPHHHHQSGSSSQLSRPGSGYGDLHLHGEPPFGASSFNSGGGGQHNFRSGGSGHQPGVQQHHHHNQGLSTGTSIASIEHGNLSLPHSNNNISNSTPTFNSQFDDSGHGLHSNNVNITNKRPMSPPHGEYNGDGYGGGSDPLKKAKKLEVATSSAAAGESAKKKKKTKIPIEELFCRQCGTTSSPEWRKGPLGPKTLCNACGLAYSKKIQKEKKLLQLQTDNGAGSELGANGGLGSNANSSLY